MLYVSIIAGAYVNSELNLSIPFLTLVLKMAAIGVPQLVYDLRYNLSSLESDHVRGREVLRLDCELLLA
jgi:hypothetical protein